MARFGTSSYLGCTRGPKGFQWTPDEVSRVPTVEVMRNLKSYRRLLDCGDLVETNEAAFDSWTEVKLKARQAAIAQRAADLKAIDDSLSPPDPDNSDEQSANVPPGLDAGGGGGSEDPQPSRSRSKKKTRSKKS